MKEIGVVNEEDASEVLLNGRDGGEEMSAVALFLVGADDSDADHAPPCRRGAGALAEPLRFDSDRGASKGLGVPERRPKEELHILDCFQHALDCCIRHTAGLENQGCNGVRDPIVAVGSIDGSDPGRKADLAHNVIEQDLGHAAISRGALFFAEDFVVTLCL